MLYKKTNAELHYEDFGKGPAVVVLHDQASNQELRQTHFDGLAASGCRVIIINPDGLGQGRRTLGAAEGTALVLSLLNTLGIGRAVFIGIGRGGYTTLDLLENFSRRVAAASFVVSSELAADLRRRTCSREALKALRRGRCDVLKQVFLHRQTVAAPTPRLPRLQAWIHSLIEMRSATPRGYHKDCAALLAALRLPPLLIEEESNPAVPPLATGVRNSRPWRALSAPLQGLLQALLPGEALFDDEEDPALDRG